MNDIARNDSGPIDVSVVIPLLNEEDNIVPLYEELREVMDAEPLRYEVIFVSDGSTDQTVPRITEATRNDPRVTVLELARRFGQTAAMSAGFNAARGKVIVPMDGDRQNDPHDVPRLVAALDLPAPDSWDIVSGWRKNRQDKLFSRRFPSVLANKLIKKLTWTTEIHDFGCSLKAYRREVLEDVRLYGEMHRFLPAICKWRGARVTEQVVNHRARTAGKSKYGLKRTVKVLLDLLTVKFMGDYLTKPIYFFGKVAMFFMGLTLLLGVLVIVQKFGYLTEDGQPLRMNNNVLVLCGMMTSLMVVMFLMVGIISELLMRVYHESQGRFPYKVRRTIRGGGAEAGLGNGAAPPRAASRASTMDV